MQVPVLTIHKGWCCVSFLNSLVHVFSNDSAAVKEVGSVVTWGKIQKIPELFEEHKLHVDPENVDGCTVPSSRGETNDPEDPDEFSSELKLFLVGFPQCFVCWFFCRCPSRSMQCRFFSGNRHGASSWTTRFSPRTEFLQMTDFPERAVVVTANFGSFFVMALTYAMANFVLFPSRNFLGLSTRDFSTYLEVCLAHVLSGCLVVQLSFLRPCSCVLWPVSSPFVSVIVSLSVLSRMLFCVPQPLFSADPAAI